MSTNMPKSINNLMANVSVIPKKNLYANDFSRIFLKRSVRFKRQIDFMKAAA